MKHHVFTAFDMQVWLKKFHFGMVRTSYWWLKPQVCKPRMPFFSSKLPMLLKKNPCHGYLIYWYLWFFLSHYWIIDSGSMEFVVPPADSSVFFPISVQFSATNTFSDLKVCLSFLFYAPIWYGFSHGHCYIWSFRWPFLLDQS